MKLQSSIDGGSPRKSPAKGTPIRGQLNGSPRDVSLF